MNIPAVALTLVLLLWAMFFGQDHLQTGEFGGKDRMILGGARLTFNRGSNP